MGSEMRHAVGDRIDALWTKHGGSHHGPHVEHVSMPMASFGAFLAELRVSWVEAMRERAAKVVEKAGAGKEQLWDPWETAFLNARAETAAAIRALPIEGDGR